eukprot:CAMPEP_0194213010 /NCGR_PEP_ID=MMETSP0156-20130528/13290_1 /TAXON_ID=33649 /ORGANISM="Thalassionema nitzschioides, Strain L26-B" /LENGTH=786 /DNA_ID=CAMNT_0038940951 /DNA_START=199 /DNA_END=2559 /DNA_ORIENTATION=+
MMSIFLLLLLVLVLLQKDYVKAVTLTDIVLSLQQRGILTMSQKDTIVQHLNDDDLLSLPMMHHHRSILSEEQEAFLQKYFQQEEASYRMTSDVRYYVSTLLKFQQPPILRRSDISASSVFANYNQSYYTGIVRLVGHYRNDSLRQEDDVPYRGIWGFATGEEEYALLVDIYGLHIINVTNATTPILVTFIELEAINLVRDVDIYNDITTNTVYAYVAAQSAARLHVINVTGILNNEEVGVSVVDRGREQYGHTVTVSNGFLILNSGNYNPDPNAPGCQIFDLNTNPWDPPLVGMYTRGDCHDSTLHRIRVNNVENNEEEERLFLISADGGVGKWRFVDFQRTIDSYQDWKPEFPTVYYETPKEAILGETQLIADFHFSYAHSHAFDEETMLLYAFEESNGYDVAIWNLTNAINAPVLVKTLTYSQDKTSHNAILHNGHLFKVSNKKYLGLAYYTGGFRLWDVTNADDVLEVGHYDTFQPFDNDIIIDQNELFPANTDIFTFFGQASGAWNLYTGLPSGHLLVSDLKQGLHIFDIAPDTPAVFCISGRMKVALSNGESKQVQDLQIGDMAQVDSSSFEPIVMFGHYDKNIMATYHKLKLDDGTVLEISEHHLIYIAGGNDPPVPVSTLRVGQQLQCGRRIINQSIINHQKGAYAPWTPSGKLMIEKKVLVSTYVTLQPGKTYVLGWWSYQFLAHAMTVPLRRFLFWINKDVSWLYDWAQTHWLQQPPWIMASLFLIIILPLALLLHTLEQIIIMPLQYRLLMLAGAVAIMIVRICYRNSASKVILKN